MTYFRRGTKLESWLTAALMLVIIAGMLSVFLPLARGCA